eukprot:351819-Hanusia_phi.AAC.1
MSLSTPASSSSTATADRSSSSYSAASRFTPTTWRYWPSERWVRAGSRSRRTRSGKRQQIGGDYRGWGGGPAAHRTDRRRAGQSISFCAGGRGAGGSRFKGGGWKSVRLVEVRDGPAVRMRRLLYPLPGCVQGRVNVHIACDPQEPQPVVGGDVRVETDTGDQVAVPDGLGQRIGEGETMMMMMMLDDDDQDDDNAE